MLPGAIVVERVVPPGGFEPPVSAFVARRPFQSDRGGVVRPAGLEPARTRLEDELSIQRTRAHGVPTGIRTLVSALRGRRPWPASRWGHSSRQTCTRGRIRTCGGALNRRLRCRFATLVSEPLDRLERSSPGYGPGTSPSTLERQCTAAVLLDGRRLADVRHAVCQRALLGCCSRGCCPRPARQLPGLSSRCSSRRWPLARPIY